mgnify:CR=1 FL=1
MAVNDGYLLSVPSDSNPNDGRLWDPTTAPGGAVYQAAGSFTGAGAFNVSAVVLAAGSAAFVGSGVLVGDAAPPGSVVWQGSAAFAGAGAMGVPGSLLLPGVAALSGVGSIAAAGSVVVSGAASFSGVGSFASPALVVASAQSSFSGAGTFSVGAVLSVTASAALVGQGGIAADAVIPVITVWSGSADFVASGAMFADATGSGNQWDTSQGVAKNLAENLRRAAQQGVRRRVTTDPVPAGAAVAVSARGEGRAVIVGYGAEGGVEHVVRRTTAGMARVVEVAASAGSDISPLVAASSRVPVRGCGVGARSGGAAVSAGVRVVVRGSGSAAGWEERSTPRGVMNPTDEELMTLAFQAIQRRPLTRNIKRI